MAKNYGLRRQCKNMYDIQKIRIQIYNRIISERYIEEMTDRFKSVIGDKLEKAMEKGDEEKIKKLRAVCTNAMIDEFYQIKDEVDAIRSYLKKDEFIKHRKGLIRDYTIYSLINSYSMIKNSEDELLDALSYNVKREPIYQEFLSKVKGCGPVMSAVILSEFDIQAARHVSSFWKYAGLDVFLRKVKLDDYKIELKPEKESIEAAAHALQINFDVYGNIEEFDAGDDVIDEEDDETSKIEKQFNQITAFMKDSSNLPMYGTGRSNKREHLVKVEYVSKNGEVKEKDSITYNPLLKSKLIGVLAPSFVIHGDKYRKIYDDYKYRITKANDLEPERFKRKKSHLEAMARRYMIKMFLKDLWNFWRDHEGYPREGDWYEDKVLSRLHGENAEPMA